MAQITIYLDDEVLAIVKAAVKSSGVSQSQWVADAVRARVRREWPASVRALAGAWPDFPSVAEIRKRYGTDSKRESI